MKVAWPFWCMHGPIHSIELTSTGETDAGIYRGGGSHYDHGDDNFSSSRWYGLMEFRPERRNNVSVPVCYAKTKWVVGRGRFDQAELEAYREFPPGTVRNFIVQQRTNRCYDYFMSETAERDVMYTQITGITLLCIFVPIFWITTFSVCCSKTLRCSPDWTNHIPINLLWYFCWVTICGPYVDVLSESTRQAICVARNYAQERMIKERNVSTESRSGFFIPGQTNLRLHDIYVQETEFRDDSPFEHNL